MYVDIIYISLIYKYHISFKGQNRLITFSIYNRPEWVLGLLYTRYNTILNYTLEYCWKSIIDIEIILRSYGRHVIKLLFTAWFLRRKRRRCKRNQGLIYLEGLGSVIYVLILACFCLLFTFFFVFNVRPLRCRSICREYWKYFKRLYHL